MNSKALGAARPISTRGHALALSRLQIEHRIDIARAMQHAHDIDPVVEWQVENNVASDRKTAHTGRQLLAGTTHHRLRCQQPELLVDVIHPAIGGGGTVVGDEVSDLEDVGLRERSTRHPWHSAPRRPVRPPSTRHAFERFGIPGLARPAGQPLAHIAAQLREFGLPQSILLVHQAKRLANHLARRSVETGGDLRADEFFQLGRQVDVHSHGVRTFR